MFGEASVTIVEASVTAHGDHNYVGEVSVAVEIRCLAFGKASVTIVQASVTIGGDHNCRPLD